MIKTIAYFLFSIAIAICLAIFTEISVPGPVLTTLYTVAGVIFSVGMSIAITPKTERVSNDEIRTSIRKAFQKVRNSFLLLFCIDTLVFIMAEVLETSKIHNVVGVACTIFSLISIAFFTFNFIELQRLGDSIEEQIIKETKGK